MSARLLANRVGPEGTMPLRRCGVSRPLTRSGEATRVQTAVATEFFVDSAGDTQKAFQCFVLVLNLFSATLTELTCVNHMVGDTGPPCLPRCGVIGIVQTSMIHEITVYAPNGITRISHCRPPTHAAIAVGLVVTGKKCYRHWDGMAMSSRTYGVLVDTCVYTWLLVPLRQSIAYNAWLNMLRS